MARKEIGEPAIDPSAHDDKGLGQLFGIAALVVWDSLLSPFAIKRESK